MSLHRKMGKKYSQFVSKTKQLLTTGDSGPTDNNNDGNNSVPIVNFYPEQSDLVMNNSNYFLGPEPAGENLRSGDVVENISPSGSGNSIVTSNFIYPVGNVNQTYSGRTSSDTKFSSFSPSIHVGTTSSLVARDLLNRRSDVYRGNVHASELSSQKRMNSTSESDSSSSSENLDMKRRMFLSLSSTDIRKLNQNDKSNNTLNKGLFRQDTSSSLGHQKVQQTQCDDDGSSTGYILSKEIIKPRPPPRSSSLKDLTKIGNENDNNVKLPIIIPSLKPKSCMPSSYESKRDSLVVENGCINKLPCTDSLPYQDHKQEQNLNYTKKDFLLINNDQSIGRKALLPSFKTNILSMTDKKLTNSSQINDIGNKSVQFSGFNEHSNETEKNPNFSYSSYFATRKNLIDKHRASMFEYNNSSMQYTSGKLLVGKNSNGHNMTMQNSYIERNPKLLKDVPVPLDRTLFMSRHNPERYSINATNKPKTYYLNDRSRYFDDEPDYKRSSTPCTQYEQEYGGKVNSYFDSCNTSINSSNFANSRTNSVDSSSFVEPVHYFQGRIR